MTPLAARIGRFIAAEKLLTHGSRTVVGLSGGADSTALLALLRELGYDCVAVHCHFGLRGEEAERDLRHSRKIASALGAEFEERRFDTRAYMSRHGVSAEMACRDLRYAAFDEIASERNCEAIAVGHHREDNIETMFLNLLRGCGLHGVRAMTPRRGNIVRPLLETSKAELVDYLDARKIDYITDSTNLVADVARNRLRLEVLPALRAAFPNADAKLSRSLRNLRGCEALYGSLLPPMSESIDGVGETLLHEWLAPFGFNATQCADILRSTPGAVFDSADHRLTLCVGNRFELTPIGENEAERRPTLSGVVKPRPENFKPQPGVLYLDASAAEAANWELRLWREGDRIRPFGMTGSRPVADVLADCGISATQRRRTWVLTRNDDILWVVGVRASAHFPVTETSTKIIEIHSHEKN